MVNIAIIEDDPAAYAVLEEHLSRFSEEHGVQFDIQVFRDAIAFLTDYRPVFHIVLMDIELPHLMGTDAAKRLREVDPMVSLVFITNMAQYAIKGYEVDAVDFVLKPVSYYRFSSLLQKLLRRMDERTDMEITIRTPGGMRRVPISRVAYVAVEDHLLLYHLEDEIIEAWGSLKNAWSTLPEDSFIQVNKSCIVHLRHVKGIQGDQLLIGHDLLTLSRGRKQTVLAALNQFIGR